MCIPQQRTGKKEFRDNVISPKDFEAKKRLKKLNNKQKRKNK
jgi:hypothetical protein